MITKYTHKKLTWIDLESPSVEEVRQVVKEYNIHHLVAEELNGPSVKPKVVLYDNFIYLILHFPSLRRRDDTAVREVDFIIGKDFIITTRYDTLDAFHKFSKIFEVNSILDKSDIGEHAGYVFFYMIREAYRTLGIELEAIGDSLETIQKKIFSGEEKDMVKKISEVNRTLLDYVRATDLHKDVLESFERAGRTFFGESFSYHLQSITGEYYQIEDLLDSNREFLKELRETNNSLLTTKQNEIMKTLTILAFVIVPLAFVTQLFSMNTVYLPIVGIKYDFWIVVGIMIAAALAMLAFFKYKKWL